MNYKIKNSITSAIPKMKNFTKRKLSNGMTILHEYRDLPVVSFGISNPFAGSHESSEIKGVAHFIEHLLFTGTHTRTHEDISREIEKKGGVLNAFTAQDVTSYWFKLPAQHLFAGIDIIVDMLKNPAFKPDKFEKEKKVILEEIKMNHDIPQRFVHEQLLANLYEGPFGEGIIGSEKTVNALTRNFVADFYSKNYSPENFIVTIVGKSDIEKVCAYLEKEFKAQNKQYKNLPIKKHTDKHTTEERPGIDQAHFLFGIHSPMPDDKQRYVLEVLDAYLASGMSSQLFLEIREKRGLAYNISSSINMEKNYSYYSIYVGTTKPAIAEVKKLILEGFKNASEKMTESDLAESKERIIGLQKVSSEESINVMNELLFTELATQDAESYYTHETRIQAVTLQQVKDFAANATKHYSTAAIIPK